MGTINLGNSLRYDMTGRKRKTKSMTTKKKSYNRTCKPLKTPQHVLDRMREAEEHRKKYPSLTGTKYSPQKDDTWKLEESKNFTVAPAYNKGAYQVIARENIKDIGK